MAKFVKFGDYVLNIEQIAGFKFSDGSLSIYLSGHEEPVTFGEPQSSPVYANLIELLKPDAPNIPAKKDIVFDTFSGPITAQS